MDPAMRWNYQGGYCYENGLVFQEEGNLSTALLCKHQYVT